MRIEERLAAVAADAKAIKEGLTFLTPNDNLSSVGLDRDDRLVGRSGRAWERRVEFLADLIVKVKHGKMKDYHLQEAMTTSDFPLLFGDLLYRQLLGQYQPWPVTYPAYFKIVEVRDFRKLNMYTIDGGNGLLSTVKEREPYPEVSFTEGVYQIAVVKHGKRYSISFEMVINDDLMAFQDRPGIMASMTRRSEEWLATTMMADANGPHASFFTAGNANKIVANTLLSTPVNPPLSLPALEAAMSQLRSRVDSDGQPILINMVTLVVPPALEILAQNLLNAFELWLVGADGGASSTQQLHTKNWLQGRVRLEVNPYLPIVSSSANGQTSWYLVASTADPAQRPAFIFGFMRGRRTPQLFIKDGNQRQLGGGAVDPLEGSFENDSIDYKVRHIYGAAQGDPKMAMASNGSGS